MTPADVVARLTVEFDHMSGASEGPANPAAKDHHVKAGQAINKQIVLINNARQPQSFRADWTAIVSGKQVAAGHVEGSLAVSEIRFIPLQMTAPMEAAGNVPESMAGKDMILALGALDDFDNTYFNGVEIGHTDGATNTWWLAPRNYVVPGRLVKPGSNAVAVRLFDRFNEGGFVDIGDQRSAGGDQPGPQATGVARRGGSMVLRVKTQEDESLGAYHPDYRMDFPQGDNPYRYYRW
jgi:hypothetical protein